MATAYTSNRFAVLTSAPTKQPQPRAQKDKATVQAQKAQVAQELRAAKTDEPKKQDSDDNKGQRRQGQGNNNRGPRDNQNRAPREPRAEGERRERTDGDRANKNRKFDRRPGTGRAVNEEKKGGHGKQNWGSVTDAVTAGVEGTEPTTDATGETNEETPKVEEPKTFTLAEYEQQLAENLVKIDRPPPRVVEEDETLKSKYVKVEKKHEAFVPGKPKKNKDNNKSGGQKKQVIPITQILDVKPADTRSPKGGRGGKGQNRGGKGGQQNQSFNLDESAFPKLG